MIGSLLNGVRLAADANVVDPDTVPESTDTSTAFGAVMEKLAELVNTVWPYLIIAAAAIVIIWGMYIGIRIAVARKNEDQINARGMIKNLAIGLIVIFLIMVAVPLIMEALCAWAGVSGIDLSAWFSFM